MSALHAHGYSHTSLHTSCILLFCTNTEIMKVAAHHGMLKPADDTPKFERDEDASDEECSPADQTKCCVVGARGFEPPTPASRTQCATGLRYAPTRARETGSGKAIVLQDGGKTQPMSIRHTLARH